MKRLPVVYSAAVATLAAACVARAANLVLEAESAVTNEAPMVTVSLAAPPPGIPAIEGASGNAYLEVPLGAGKTPKVKAGTATFVVDIPVDGAYTVWLRSHWAGECSNTFLAQIDDHPPFLVGGDSTFRTWHWVKYPVSKLTPPPRIGKGRHTLRILHREDGVRLDQLLLTTEPRYVPVAAERAGVSP